MFTAITPEILWGGLIIFLLRTLDMSMDTLRVLFVVRGKKVLVWILGVVQSCIYVVAISNVLKGDLNIFTVLCYAAGFATGNIVGMKIEDMLAIGFKTLSIISKSKGSEIAEALRTEGFGATELPGRGRDGDVMIITCSIKRKQVSDVEKVVSEIDSESFITEDDFKPINSGGFWRK